MPVENKRAVEAGALVPSKKSRKDVVAYGKGQNAVSNAGPPRTSSLLAPIMLLQGHEGEVYCCKFHPDGNLLASASFDKTIFLWNVYGECENYAVLRGHKGAIMELHFNTEGTNIVTCGTDKLVCLWDLETGNRIKQMKGHTSFVNSCHTARRGPPLVVSGSDDSTIKVWDSRRKGEIQEFQNTYQVLAVSFNDTSDQIISGGIDNTIKPAFDDILQQASVSENMPDPSPPDDLYQLSVFFPSSEHFLIRYSLCPLDVLRLSPHPHFRALHLAGGYLVWDMRKNDILYKMTGHMDSVTGLSLSPDGSYIMSNAMDNTVRIWDVRPFAPAERCVKLMQGHSHNFEKNLLRCAWAPDGSKVGAGSADRFVYVWDTTTRRLLYKLPGHTGSVNDIDFHPEEPILVSGSSDKQIFLGEIV